MLYLNTKLTSQSFLDGEIILGGNPMDKKEKKRKHIIDVAIKLFIKHGFNGTPTSLIAKESKIATGTLFNYFKTKDILINEIFREVKLEQKKYILNSIERENGLKNKLKKIWINLIIWGLEQPEKKKFLEYVNNSYRITEHTKSEVKKNYEFLFEIFREIKDKKSLKKVDEVMLILNFTASCIYTGKYFEFMDKKYDEKIVLESFERFCKSIDLTEED